ncbi:MAG: response regulator, partial [Chloroflexota bacterium]|nr:response regulator [Chloroflexota bacterium]
MHKEQKGIKVLLVDDEPDFLALTKAFLEREHAEFSIDTTTSAEEGLELLKGGKYDVVVSDYKMPGMDGLEFLKTLRASGNTIPFIMFTGKGREEVAIEALNRGANGYLQKGVDIESMYGTLMHAIKQEVETKRAEDVLRETRDYLEKLINYANAPTTVWDPESKISQFNHAFEHLTGYAASEVIGQKLSMLFPEASRDDSLSRIAHTLSGEYWESVEIPILRKDGDIRLALWNSANIYAEDGTTLLATIAQGTDITERKRAEEKIEHLNAVLRAIRRVNQLVVREKDREKLLQSICDDLIETRGYHSAWIALIDKKGGFETAAQAGVDKEFSAMIDKLKSGELPRYVQKTVEQTGIVMMTNPAVECRDCPLVGIYPDKARFTIRLEYGGRIYGFVNVAIPVEM